MKNKIGLYIHIPFCLKKCLYCDFCSFPAMGEEQMHRYRDAVLREMAFYAERARGKEVDTVFFGGGTPTLFPLADIERVLAAISRLFSLAPDAEISMEANPASADGAKLASLRRIGINRLSIGLQSACDEELAALGRVHTAAEGEAFYVAARGAGFDNINLDIMYGIPHQTLATFSATLEKVFSLAPEHLSVYGLMLEEGTPFFKDKTLVLPGEDSEMEMYHLLLAGMKKAGYERYEISNYAKPGFACRHNLNYWYSGEYLGFGTAAASFFAGERYTNGRDFSAYCADPLHAVSERTVLSEQERAYEYIMLRFRLSDGIDEDAYFSRFGINLAGKYRAQIENFCSKGLMKRENGRLFLTDEGMELSNAILIEFLPED